MEEHKDLTAEIDALIQNTGKKKISAKTSYNLEIVVDKKNSSVDIICGEFFIVTEEKFLDGEIERSINTKHSFRMEKDKDFIIEKYDEKRGVNREILKMLRDSVSSVLSTAGDGKISMPITCKNVFNCPAKQVLIVCETGRNNKIKELVRGMLFAGKANSHIDTEEFGYPSKEKGYKWAILELERRVANGESVIITGQFNNWYELMPVAVVSSMYGYELSIGRSAGQRLSIGDVVDINIVLDHFMSKKEFLSQFYNDPYSAIEEFRKTDVAINSLIIFPSILHNFFKR